MVLYFSATGNTEFIAKELAERLDDECVNLLERVKTNNHEPLSSEKPFVICAPQRLTKRYRRNQSGCGRRRGSFICRRPFPYVFYVFYQRKVQA